MLRLPVGFGVGALLVATVASAQRPPDLQGQWTLRPDGADSVTVTDSAGPPLEPPLRPLVRPGTSAKARERIGRLVGMAQAVPSFQIEQADSTITFVNADGFTYTVRPDGPPTHVVAGTDSIETRARWKRRQLEIEFRPPGGGKLIERYLLADSGLFLRLEVVIEDGALAQRLWRPRMYRRVTD
ncbi:MAG: hypothetical protein OER21_06155 [Gemmatimonadota bacterium]|nr:hypothetical protein [Gemmatimonadota bacterium]